MVTGQRISNRYELIQRVGTGPLAITYLAKDLALDRSVVVKTLRSEFMSEQDLVHRFQREAKKIAALSHPNLAAIREVGIEDGLPYLVAEYLPKGSLGERLALPQPVSTDAALGIAIRVAAALGVYHAQNLVHGDLKPSNVMFAEDESVKVSDGGMGRVLASAQVEGETRPRSLSPYVSPEEAAGRLPTPASDVYSLGVMLHEMLTGQHPNDHSMVSTSAQVTPLEIVSRTPTHTPGVPSSLAHILNQMLSVDPRDRYASAQQLHHILLRYQRQRRGSGPNSMPTNGQAVVREQDRGRDPPSARTEDTEVVGVTYSDIADQEQGTDWPFLILSLLVVLAILGLILLWTAIRRQYIFPRG